MQAKWSLETEQDLRALYASPKKEYKDKIEELIDQLDTSLSDIFNEKLFFKMMGEEITKEIDSQIINSLSSICKNENKI